MVKAGAAVNDDAHVERPGQPKAVVAVPAQGVVPPAARPLVPSRPQTARDHASYYLQV